MITRNLLLAPVMTSLIWASLSSFILTRAGGRGYWLLISSGVGSFLINSMLILFYHALVRPFLYDGVGLCPLNGGITAIHYSISEGIAQGFFGVYACLVCPCLSETLFKAACWICLSPAYRQAKQIAKDRIEGKRSKKSMIGEI